MISRSFYEKVLQNVVETKQVKDMAAVLAFFNKQKSLISSNKNNWETYTAHKEKDYPSGL